MNRHVARKFDLSVYLVTDPRDGGSKVIETVGLAAAGGVTLVQLREPGAAGREFVARARALVALLRPLGIPLIVNDRVDVALAAGADGVHLGQDDMEPLDARRLLGPDAVIGLSVGSPAELALSASQLAVVDYLGTGPVHATRTKDDAGGAIGVDGLAAVRALTALPVVAIGGLTAADAPALIRAGADGLAVVSAICAAPDPGRAARELRDAVTAARA